MKLRLTLVSVIGTLWVLGLFWRLEYLQVEQHSHYRDRAVRQQQRDVALEPPRGTIFDVEGRRLAISSLVESAFAVPPDVEDAAATADTLAEILSLDREDILARLTKDRDFVWIQRKLNPTQVEAIRAQNLKGIAFLPESRRFYPMGELAAPILGFVGTDHRGLEGLEAHYESQVAGTPGRRTVLRDALASSVSYPGLAFEEPRPGRDLHLTLDAAIQQRVEDTLNQTLEKSRAPRGIAVVMDVHTGAIVAMATRPSFDPNHFGDYSKERWRNGAISDAYEPGSTFKVVTVAGVLEHGLLTPEEEIDCEMGGITLGKTRINDHHPFGVLSVADILKKSSNVGTIKMGLFLGEGRLYAMVRRLGFGQLTGIDLPGESLGILRPLKQWEPLTKAYVSFGQGVAVTPVQLARALAVVANGGFLVDPYIVERIDDELTPLAVRATQSRRRVLTESTTRELREMLGYVVEGGTGTKAQLEGYSLAGKTGTAQVAVKGGYSSHRFIASFGGFGPLEDPRYVAVVSIDSPRGLTHGGQVAAPAFSSIIQSVFIQKGVRPRRTLALDLPSPRDVRVPLHDLESQWPDLRGWTAKEVLRWAEREQVVVHLNGHGWVDRLESQDGVLELWLETSASWRRPEAA